MMSRVVTKKLESFYVPPLLLLLFYLLLTSGFEMQIFSSHDTKKKKLMCVGSTICSFFSLKKYNLTFESLVSYFYL